MRLAAYARFSSDLQDARSITDQMGLLHDYAKRQGWDVVEEFSDAGIQSALSKGDAASLEAVSIVRSLIREIRVIPEADTMGLQVKGALSVLLGGEQGLNKRDFLDGCGDRIWA